MKKKIAVIMSALILSSSQGANSFADESVIYNNKDAKLSYIMFDRNTKTLNILNNMEIDNKKNERNS